MTPRTKTVLFVIGNSLVAAGTCLMAMSAHGCAALPVISTTHGTMCADGTCVSVNPDPAIAAPPTVK